MLVERKAAPTKNVLQPVGSANDIELYGTSYVGMAPIEIKYPDDDYAYLRGRAINNTVKDGVMPMTAEEQDFERSWNWKMIKKFTMSIFKLDFANFSFPCAYSEERSFLERTADIFTFLANTYIEKTNTTNDPKRKIALIAAGVIASFHLQMASKKPWNPILGETLIARWPNGAVLYGEQVCHHPAISDFQIYGPNNSWYCDAELAFKISIGPSQVDVMQNGMFNLKVGDITYQWEFPAILVNGVIKGDRTTKVKGPFILKDITNKLVCQVDLNPKKNKKIPGLENPRMTTIYGGIKAEDAADYELIITGDFTQCVKLGEEVIWDINNNIAKRPIVKIPPEEILLSDSRYRIDRMYIIDKDLDNADKAKVVMEEAQRRDKKLRK